jgi:hypothetical protein
MPERYTKMRDKFKTEGLTAKLAKQKAARIFNATRGAKEAPVTRKEHSKTKRS